MSNLGYGARVATPDGPGMIVKRTSRTYHVLLDGSGGTTNYGRHFGEGATKSYPFADVSVVIPSTSAKLKP